MISLKLVGEHISGKCLLTQIQLNKHRKLFFHENKKKDHPPIYGSDAPVAHTDCKKHLGMYLAEKLHFPQHIKEKTLKAIRGIVVIQELRHILPRYSVITMYKSFVRPHFG